MDTPPPPQRVARPRVLPRFFMAWMSVTMIRQPVAPTGWPRPMPEPFTLVISRLMPELLFAAQVLGGKGLVQLDELEVVELDPERFMRLRTAGAGLNPMMEGWQPP